MSWTAATLLVAPWLILGGYGLAVLLSTPRRAGPTGFFGGRGHDGATPGIILLGASAAISWVMAKSVNNAMNLAADFGWIGGIGYAAYWLAFVVVAVAVYVMRTRGGFTSLAGFLKHKVKNAVKFISRYEEVVAHEASRRGVDGVVCGHIHRAEITRIGDISYHNCGDWVESCTALVEHHDGRWEIINWADIVGSRTGVARTKPKSALPA